jgi:hypothetical protein
MTNPTETEQSMQPAALREERVDVQCPRCEHLFRNVTEELASYILMHSCAACQAGAQRKDRR